MSKGITAQALAALRTSKGATVSGIAALALFSLVSVGIKRGGQAPSLSGSISAMAQGADVTTGSVPSAAAGVFTPEQVKALHAIIKDYLVANPEVLAEVSQALEKKQAAEQQVKAEQYLVEHKPKVFASAGDFVIGNPKGDITVVEFFDYNCGWCKRAVDDLLSLTKSDPRVRVVLKEYPIFGGPPSVLAAKAAMASIKQNKYWEYHAALMREKQVNEQTVFAVAQRVGLDVARLKTDMADKRLDGIIEQNIQVGQGLGIEGTPGFVIDSRVNVGYVPASGMRQMIGEIRKQGCKIC